MGGGQILSWVHAYSATVMFAANFSCTSPLRKGYRRRTSRRAPSYMDAVKHLESVGVITADMREWVDEKKSIGNDANHELTPFLADQANGRDLH